MGTSGADLDKVLWRAYGRIAQYFPSAARCIDFARRVGCGEADTADTCRPVFCFAPSARPPCADTTSRAWRRQRRSTVGETRTLGGIGGVCALAAARSGNWGIAAFVDVGDAAVHLASWSRDRVGLESAATVAGTLAVDVAYGERESNFDCTFPSPSRSKRNDEVPAIAKRGRRAGSACLSDGVRRIGDQRSGGRHLMVMYTTSSGLAVSCCSTRALIRALVRDVSARCATASPRVA